MATSIELVDGTGRKVRINITGHWQDLVSEVSQFVLASVENGAVPDPQGESFALSDLEES